MADALEQSAAELSSLEGIREKRRREGSKMVVTLLLQTSTPRHRQLSEFYVRECTPDGLEPGKSRRKRQSAESSARGRAMCRLNYDTYQQHLAKERRRVLASRKAQRDAASERAPSRMESDWQQREVERQVPSARRRSCRASLAHAFELTCFPNTRSCKQRNFPPRHNCKSTRDATRGRPGRQTSFELAMFRGLHAVPQSSQTMCRRNRGNIPCKANVIPTPSASHA